ncbi:MAG: hypothetical protein MJZ73_11110 [Bacteroidaceae bacterium]|nr:hypothetical protein [Bacteroidaceae bacterium]
MQNTENIKSVRTVILAAEEAEYKKCCELFPDMECILMGVGAGNVIKTCSQLPEGTRIINIGYAGSNCLEIGTVTTVSESHRLMTGSYFFTDHANPMHLSDKGYPCYTNNDFVTSSDKTEPTLFDMELNYIAAFSPRLELVASIKVVSDNLNVEAFRNNAIRESGILTCNEVWKKVREVYEQL